MQFQHHEIILMGRNSGRFTNPFFWTGPVRTFWKKERPPPSSCTSCCIRGLGFCLLGVVGPGVGWRMEEECEACQTSHVTGNRGTRHTSHVTRHTSHGTEEHDTRHTSHVTRHTSHVTRHTSHIARHTSHIARHTSHVTHSNVNNLVESNG